MGNNPSERTPDIYSGVAGTPQNDSILSVEVSQHSGSSPSSRPARAVQILEEIAQNNLRMHTSRGCGNSSSVSALKPFAMNRVTATRLGSAPMKALDVIRDECEPDDPNPRETGKENNEACQSDIVDEEREAQEPLPQIKKRGPAAFADSLQNILVKTVASSTTRSKDQPRATATETKSRNAVAASFMTTTEPNMAKYRIFTQQAESVRTLYPTAKRRREVFFFGQVYRYYNPEHAAKEKLVKRMAEATDTAFRYFSASYGYWLTLPLGTINYTEIEWVRCVRDTNTKNKKLWPQKHLFEVRLKSGCSRLAATNRNFASHQPPTISPSGTWGNTSLFNTVTRNTTTNFEATLAGGTLRREIDAEEKARVRTEKKEVRGEMVFTTNGVSFDAKEKAEGYAGFVKVNKKRIEQVHKLEPQGSPMKSPMRTKGGRGNGNGTVNEGEEQTAGGSLVFAVDTIEDCERWVGLLSWLLSSSTII